MHGSATTDIPGSCILARLEASRSSCPLGTVLPVGSCPQDHGIFLLPSCVTTNTLLSPPLYAPAYLPPAYPPGGSSTPGGCPSPFSFPYDPIVPAATNGCIYGVPLAIGSSCSVVCAPGYINTAGNNAGFAFTCYPGEPGSPTGVLIVAPSPLSCIPAASQAGISGELTLRCAQA